MQSQLKRLFFGLEVKALWPESLPRGRLLAEKNRHLTLVFLGSCDIQKLEPLLPLLPLPSFKVGSVGVFDQLLFLPPHHPHVVAWHIKWLEDETPLLQYIDTLHSFLNEKGFSTDLRKEFLSHVTIARSPFTISEWKKSFSPLPLHFSSLHLYESLGHSDYSSIWSYPILSPFEEISHTADLAYLVRGADLRTLFAHAQMALAFSFPHLLPYIREVTDFQSLTDIIIALNEMVTQADHEIGCPFKAVSFHDKMEKKNGVIEWEMIIDV